VRQLIDLAQKRCWIFDLDGTLTVKTQDFDLLRRDLALPAGAPILEAIAASPPERAAELLVRVRDWERAHAEQAQPALGARPLLDRLSERGLPLGILTRNTRSNALLTLERCGLSDGFDPVDVLGRDEAAAKPSPAGVQLLLARWGISSDGAVVVGDYLHDLQAARAAGATSVLVDADQSARFAAAADLVVRDLRELIPGT